MDNPILVEFICMGKSIEILRVNIKHAQTDGDLDQLLPSKTFPLNPNQTSANKVDPNDLFCLIGLLLYIPSQQLRSWRDGQFT